MIIAGKRVTGAIFDVDGTLFDSMPIWENVGNEFLLRKDIIPREDLARTFKTMSLEESAAYYRKHYGIQETSELIIKGITEIIQDAYRNTVPLKDGAMDFLQRLKEEEIPMCIATATDAALIKLAFKRTGIDGYFEQIITCGQVGYSKESPYVYDTAREFMKTCRETTLVVEDAVHAARTAKRAGYLVLGIYDAAEEEQEQLMKIADFYVPTWDALRGRIE